MGATMTTVDAITKEIYGPRIVDQLENETTLLKRIEKTSEGTESTVGGKYVTFPLKVGRNHGIGYRNELEQLQNPGQQAWRNVRVPLRYGYGRVNMSGQTMTLAEKNYQAFSSAMTEEMEGLKQDLQKDTNRILWGNGTGRLCVFGANAAANTFVCTSGFDYMEVGMVLDVMQAAALPATVATSRTITAINRATKAVTFSGAAFTTTAGDFAVRAGNYGREPQGLESLVNNSTATLFNLSSTTEPLWQSEVKTGQGALSEPAMVAMCDQLRQNGGRPTVIFTDLGSRRAYLNLLVAQRRFTDTKNFEGGLTGLAFAYDDDIPLVTDVDATPGAMYFLREPDFKVYRDQDWHWEDTDGKLWKWVTNYDAFEALIKKYWEFAIQRRNTQGVIQGITAG